MPFSFLNIPSFCCELTGESLEGPSSESVAAQTDKTEVDAGSAINTQGHLFSSHHISLQIVPLILSFDFTVVTDEDNSRSPRMPEKTPTHTPTSVGCSIVPDSGETETTETSLRNHSRKRTPTPSPKGVRKSARLSNAEDEEKNDDGNLL